MGVAGRLSRGVGWERLGVEWAVLFGSSARGRGRDVDILVKAEHLNVDVLVDVILAAADALGVDPSMVDVVEASRAPCPEVLDAWRRGVVLYERRPGAAREWLLYRVLLCWDYKVMREKLRVVETALEAARRRWGMWGR